jgi:hypothetical protein
MIYSPCAVEKLKERQRNFTYFPRKEGGLKAHKIHNYMRMTTSNPSSSKTITEPRGESNNLFNSAFATVFRCILEMYLPWKYIELFFLVFSMSLIC